MTGRCPRCDCRAPHLHPAMQYGGEVELCTHDYHLTPSPQNRPEYIQAVLAKRARLADMSTNEVLASMGYAQRKSASADHGQREIYHIASGEVVGLYRAEQAIEAARAHSVRP